MVKNGRIRLNLTLLQRKNSGNDTPCIYSIITLFKTKHIMINYESINYSICKILHIEKNKDYLSSNRSISSVNTFGYHYIANKISLLLKALDLE